MPRTVIIDAESPTVSPFGRLLAYGGDPGGRDDVHAAVTRWRGWRRRPTAIDHPEIGRVSVFTAPAYPSSFLDLRSAELDLRWTPAAARARDAAFNDLERVRLCLASDKVARLHVPLDSRDRQPMPHQLQAISAAREMRFRCLLADDMGLGKTASALWIAELAQAFRVLILCPVSVKRNWLRELRMTLGEQWETLLIDGSRRKRADQFVTLTHLLARSQNEGLQVAVAVNYDLLIHLSPEQNAQLRDFAEGAMIVCDESHALKTRTSQRTKAVRELAEGAKHRLLLTGTPIRNTVEDVYSQVELLRPGTWTSFSDFAKRHLVIQTVDFGKRRAQKVVGSKNVDELNRVLNTLQIRRKKEEVLSLPPKTHTFPELELDEITARVYRAMKDFAVLRLQELEPSTSVFDPKAGSAVEAAMRCEQIAQGFVGGIPEPLMERLSKSVLKHGEAIPGRPNEIIFPHAPKLVWLRETIGDVLAQGGRPVVFSRFNAPMQWLNRELGKQDVRVSWLHGALSSQEKDENIERFQKGETEVFLCQVKMAEGFNLVQSQDVLFLGRDWSPAVNAQAEDRCHRIGQKGTVNIQVPIVLKTVEWPIHNRLIAKEQDAESALRSMTIGQLKEAL